LKGEKSKVWWMDLRTRQGRAETSPVVKMQQLFDEAGFADMIGKGDRVAIKLHMGEYNTANYLRPVYVSAMVEKVREAGGEPFVTDTCTNFLLHDMESRVLALDHIKTAARNGFAEATVGAPIIIADGPWGVDDVLIDLPEGVLLRNQYVAAAIIHADVLIALSHFKGHYFAFGGAIKNIGVGCASARGKRNLHSHYVYPASYVLLPWRCLGKACDSWKDCEDVCPNHAVTITETGIEWDSKKCPDCPHIPVCRQGVWANASQDAVGGGPLAGLVAIADSARAVVKAVGEDKVGFINLAADISPTCDCNPYADVPMVPDLGIFASKDPVAIDTVCLEMVDALPGIPGTGADPYALEPGTAKFYRFGHNPWLQIKAGVMNGLGTTDYDLVEMKPKSYTTAYGVTLPSVFRPWQETWKIIRELSKTEPLVPQKGFKREYPVEWEEILKWEGFRKRRRDA